MTSDMFDFIRLGREIIDDGRLKALREQLGFSANVMAELLHISPMTYRNWERGTGERMRPMAAERLGRFFSQASQAAALALGEQGIHLGDLVPFHLVAAAAGMPHEMLLNKCRTGQIDGIELGILGLWLRRTDLHKLGVDDL